MTSTLLLEYTIPFRDGQSPRLSIPTRPTKTVTVSLYLAPPL